MNGLVRRDMVFSEHASVSLFECLIVAGAPATGLLQDVFRYESTLQMTLQLLRDMWQRADRLYIPRADLECLHRMECISTMSREMSIPDQIASEPRKLSRYYIYLLFRYCMSSAGLKVYQWGNKSNRVLSSQWKPEKHAACLVDVPVSWLEPKVCTNYPSAPPVPEVNNSVSKPPLYDRPQQLTQPPLHQHPRQHLPQQLPVEHMQYPQQQQPQSQPQPQPQQQPQQQPQPLYQRCPPKQLRPLQIRQYYQDMDTKQDQRLSNSKQLYSDPTEHQFRSSHTKPDKEEEVKARAKLPFSQGCYRSSVESDED